MALRKSPLQSLVMVVKSMYKNTRICKCCGRSFTAKYGRQVHCSNSCSKQYRQRSKRLKLDAKKSASEIESIRETLDWRIRSKLTPSIAHIIDPRYLFLSSNTLMQAVGIENHTSLHSI